MTHEQAWERLPDLLASRDDGQLRSHVSGCHLCQRQLFRLARVDQLLRQARPNGDRSGRARVLAVRLRTASATLVAVGIAAGFVLFLSLPRTPAPPGFVLRARDGRAVGTATVSPVDRANVEVSLVARGMTRAGGGQFLLWARSGEAASATPIGPFMVDRTGSCRAHFNLPRGQGWNRFWVTPAARPSVVVATT